MAKKSAPEARVESSRVPSIGKQRSRYRDGLSPASDIIPGFDGPEPTSKDPVAQPFAPPVIERRDQRVWRTRRGPRPIGDFLLWDVLLAAGVVVTVVFCVLIVVRSQVDHSGSGTAVGGSGGRGVRLLDGEPPRETPKVGSYTESRIAANGEVRVTQWIRSRRPLLGVRLRIPNVPVAESVRATGLLVAADGTTLDEPKTLGPSGRQISFDTPARVVHLSYTLSGVVERSSSVPGRALARVTALDTSYHPHKGAARLTVISHKVLSTACAATATSALRPCGTPSDNGHWTVVLHGAERGDSVAAQVNFG